MRIFIITFLMLITISCDNIFDFDVVGNGEIEVYNPKLESAFSSVVLNSNFELEIIQWSKDSLSIEAESNLQPFIGVTINKETLNIGTNDNKTLIPQHKIRLKLFVDSISSIENSGNGKIYIDSLSVSTLSVNQINNGSFKTRICKVDSFRYLSQGANFAHINGDFQIGYIHQIGSGELTLSGASSKIKWIQEGSGKINSYDLSAFEADVQLYGTGLVFCQVRDLLSVKVEGEGVVYYKGSPKITSELSNSASLIKEY